MVGLVGFFYYTDWIVATFDTKEDAEKYLSKMEKYPGAEYMDKEEDN